MNSPSLVFIDVDRCLIRDDTISAFLMHLIIVGALPKQAMVKAGIGYLGYRLNWFDPEKMARRGVAALKGFSEDFLQQQSQYFFDRVIRHRYRRVMLDEIAMHQTAQRPIYLLTGGLPYIPHHIASDLKLAGVQATVAQVEQGYFTGRVVGPVCVGTGKLTYAKQLAKNHQTTLASSWFYTDSFSDTPLLEQVGQPRVVNPDRKLATLAKKKHWWIIHS